MAGPVERVVETIQRRLVRDVNQNADRLGSARDVAGDGRVQAEQRAEVDTGVARSVCATAKRSIGDPSPRSTTYKLPPWNAARAPYGRSIWSTAGSRSVRARARSRANRCSRPPAALGVAASAHRRRAAALTASVERRRSAATTLRLVGQPGVCRDVGATATMAGSFRRADATSAPKRSSSPPRRQAGLGRRSGNGPKVGPNRVGKGARGGLSAPRARQSGLRTPGCRDDQRSPTCKRP